MPRSLFSQNMMRDIQRSNAQLSRSVARLCGAGTHHEGTRESEGETERENEPSVLAVLCSYPAPVKFGVFVVTVAVLYGLIAVLWKKVVSQVFTLVAICFIGFLILGFCSMLACPCVWEYFQCYEWLPWTTGQVAGSGADHDHNNGSSTNDDSNAVVV